MTSLTVILSQKQNEWPTAIEKNKESNNKNLHTTAVGEIGLPSAAATTTAETSSSPFNYMNIIKEKKMNQCTFCPKKFTKPSTLKAHLYSHTGEKPHSCPYADCHRHFSLLSNLRRHIKTHVPVALKRQQQQQPQQRRNNHQHQRPSAVAPTDNKRRIHTLLPSPYASSVRIFSGPPVQQQQQQQLTRYNPYHQHQSQYHTATHIQTPI